MTTSKPISTARTVWLIARLALRRQLNIWQSARFRRKKSDALALSPAGSPARSGTPSKSRGRSIFSGFILLIMAFNGFNFGSRGLIGLSETARDLTVSSDSIAVSRYTRNGIVEGETALNRAGEIFDPVQRDKYVGLWHRHLDQLFLSEVRIERLSEEDESSRVQQMRDGFDQKGAAGFTVRPGDTFWVSRDTWPSEAQPSSLFLSCLGLIVLLWMGVIIFGALGLNNKNLGEVEWNFEWLFTFPASARSLFTSKLFVYSFLNPVSWVFFFPFMALVFVSAGYGLIGILVGFAVILYLLIVAGSICTFLEVVLRKRMSLSQLKNTQAVFTVLTTASFLLVIAACVSKSLDEFIVARATAIPEFLIWNPFLLPLILGLPSAGPSQTRIVVVLMIVLGLAFCALALVGSEWLTRDGLVKAGGPYQGTRKPSPPRTRREGWLRGIAAHEMLLLTRDRNLLVQVLIVPLFVPVFYLLIYSGMASAVSGNFRHAAVMAFGVGAYSLLSSAMPILNREDKTLWQLLTFPQSLTSIFVKKALVWAVLGLLYGCTTLAIISRFSRHLRAESWGQVGLALYGIVLYAFIAAGIGILATNVLETERRARFRTDMVYLYMMLAAMYANTIYSLSIWSKLAQLVLSTLLAFALWQKVRDDTPYVLDPVARPPRSIGLADGMIAALAFFVGQGLIFLFIHMTSDVSMPAQVSVAYIFSGLIVTGVALLIFWRQGVPDLWMKVGFSRSHDEAKSKPFAIGVLRAVALGGLASVGAILYLRVLNLFPQGQIWKQDAELSSFLSRADRPIWICILAIVAAPLFEEFLFRGLIFQGLRRTAGPALAVIGSAALFALVHPPISVIPVFILGVAAAISFQKSGFLLAPILTHAIYNTVVIFFNRF